MVPHGCSLVQGQSATFEHQDPEARDGILQCEYLPLYWQQCNASIGCNAGEKVNPERSYIITFWIFKTNLSIPLLWLCLCVEVGWGQVCGANTNIHIAKLS